MNKEINYIFKKEIAGDDSTSTKKKQITHRQNYASKRFG